jgi:hypothetical protein
MFPSYRERTNSYWEMRKFFLSSVLLRSIEQSSLVSRAGSSSSQALLHKREIRYDEYRYNRNKVASQQNLCAQIVGTNC